MNEPSPHNVNPKHDPIAWDQQNPRAGDFRPPSEVTRTTSVAAAYLAMAGLTAAASLLVGWAISFASDVVGPAPALPEALLTAALVGLVLYARLPWPNAATTNDHAWKVGPALVGVLFLAAASVRHLEGFRLGLFMLAGGAAPALAAVADRFAANALFWTTADSRVPASTRGELRAAWRRRFEFPQPPGLARAHAVRLALLSLGYVAAIAGGLLTPRGLTPLQPFVPMAALTTTWLLLVAVASGDQSWGRFRHLLAHWREYRRDRRVEPGVFQSPAGGQLTRSLATHGVIALLAACWFLVATGSFTATRPSVGAVTHTGWLVLLTSAGGASLIAPLQVLLAFAFLSAPHDDPPMPGASVDSPGGGPRPSQDNREQPAGPPPLISFGYGIPGEFPICAAPDDLLEGVHILGGPGTGKTSLGLIPLVNQLVALEDSAVVVLDGKGDPALFHSTRVQCGNNARAFKYFTTKPDRSTYLFNPLNQRHLDQFSLREVVGYLISSLNLHHGDDHGRAYFSVRARSLVTAAISNLANQAGGSGQPLRSFDQLRTELRLIAQGDALRDGLHLIGLVEELASMPQLNVFRADDQNPQSAIDAAIHFPEVIAENQVAYFWLEAAMDFATTAEIQRLAVYSAYSAAIAHQERTGRRARLFIVCDEAQTFIAANIANVLEQGRSRGVAMILCHQSLSQLNPPGATDFRDLFLACTGIKMFFSCREQRLRDYISSASGETTYYSRSWNQLKARVVRDGRVGQQYACGTELDGKPISIREEVGPRLTNQDLNDYSRQTNTCVTLFERHLETARFNGAVPTWIDHAYPKETHQQHIRTPWPAPTEATIVTRPIGCDERPPHDDDVEHQLDRILRHAAGDGSLPKEEPSWTA